ncbi:MAG: hypothetical protein AAGH78_15220 [Cyanobacteria bacterium P01_H01_bin.58]
MDNSETGRYCFGQRKTLLHHKAIAHRTPSLPKWINALAQTLHVAYQLLAHVTCRCH